MNHVELIKIGYFIFFIRIIQIQILALYGYYYNDEQFLLTFCGFVTLPLFVAFSSPVEKLYKQMPYHDLMDPVNKYSFLGATFFAIILIGISVVQIEMNEFNEDSGLLNDNYRVEGEVNTILYLYGWVYGFNTYFPLCYSAPFKKSVIYNWPMFTVLMALLIYGLLMILIPEYAVPDFMDLVILDFNIRI